MPTHHELSVSDQEQASFWLVKKYNQQIYQELPTFLSFHLKLSRCSVGPNEMSWCLWMLRKFYPWKSWLPSVMRPIPRPKSTCSTRQTRGKIMDWTFERLEILEKMAWRRVALNFFNLQLWWLFWVQTSWFHGFLCGFHWFHHTDLDDRIDAACDLKSPRCKEAQGEWKTPKMVQLLVDIK